MQYDTLLRRSARTAELALGFVFLAGALLKAHDINLFSVQISYYGVVSGRGLVDGIAVFVVALETLLGAALVLGLRLRGVLHAVVAGLLVVFTGLIAYAWRFHDLEDCGCMGSIEMSPGISIAKNVVLLAFTSLAFWAVTQGIPRSSGGTRRRWVAGVLSVVLAVAAAGYSYRHLEAPSPKTATEGRFAEFVFEAAGRKWDLGQGDYFVTVLSATCDHCRASVPALNDLALDPAVPPMIGLIEGEPDTISDFETTVQPVFGLHPISIKTFFDLIGADGPPRFYAVRDGVPVVFWDEHVPSPTDVAAALATEG